MNNIIEVKKDNEEYNSLNLSSEEIDSFFNNQPIKQVELTLTANNLIFVGE